jgi:hypothetical protein
MAEQLIKVIYAKWEEAPGACDNRIKKETWHKGANRANRVKRSGVVIT